MFPQGISVLMFVVVNGSNIVKKFRSTASELDKHFPRKEGQLLIGPNVYREMTLAEIAVKWNMEGSLAAKEKAARKFKKDNYLQTLVNVGNTRLKAAA